MVGALRRHDGYLADSLLYIDAPPWMLLGGLAQPGVLIRPVPPEELPEHERGESQVLVAQSVETGVVLPTFPSVPAAEVPLTDSIRVRVPQHPDSDSDSDGTATALFNRLRLGFSDRNGRASGRGRERNRDGDGLADAGCAAPS